MIENKQRFLIMRAVVSYQAAMQRINSLEEQVFERKIGFWFFLAFAVFMLLFSDTDEGSGVGVLLLFICTVYWVKKSEAAKELDSKRWLLGNNLNELERLKVVFSNSEYERGVYLCNGEIKKQFLDKDGRRWENWCAGDAVKINIWDEKLYE